MWSNDGTVKRIDQQDKTTLDPEVRVSGESIRHYLYLCIKFSGQISAYKYHAFGDHIKPRLPFCIDVLLPVFTKFSSTK